MVHLNSGSRLAFDTGHSAYFRLFDACGLLLLIQTESLISHGKCIVGVLCGDSRCGDADRVGVVFTCDRGLSVLDGNS